MIFNKVTPSILDELATITGVQYVSTERDVLERNARD
jgi:hypothetical protein